MTTHGLRSRPTVLIAGGGIGGVEAALALRTLAGTAVAIELIAPGDEFVFRPLTIAEPFGYERALRMPLSRLERTHTVRHRRDQLVGVRPDRHEVDLGSGETCHYDALVVATGARPEAWLPGSLCFAGPTGVRKLRALLERAARGELDSLAFVSPTDAWTLPAYELALLTASWCADRGVMAPALTVATPERRPLERFGGAASRVIADLLSDRGITRVTGTDPEADAVVSLPVLRTTPLPGLPADAQGFIPVDRHGAVRGAPGVYAVGDVTDQPVKQGGLATQQADAAASAIAHGLGAPVDPVPFEPVLRGQLLSGVGAAYFRRDAAGASQAAFDALWWPPTKVAGHHLGPYLTDLHGAASAGLADRPAPADPGAAAADRDAIRRIALDLADAEAGWGDPRSALRWLQVIEWLDGALPEDLAERRDAWRTAASGALT